MDFNETPVRRRRGLRFRSRQRASESAVIAAAETVGGPQSDAASAAPLAAIGEALASAYVAVARVFILGVEAVEDWRAEGRAPLVKKAPATPSHAIATGALSTPTPSRALQTKSEPT
jgi:hypothetical protein